MIATVAADPTEGGIMHSTERGSAAPHEPVLLDRIRELLAIPLATVDGPSVLVDATIGAAGHAAALLAASHEGVHLVGFDRDRDALELARRRLTAYADRLTLVHAPFDELADHVRPVADRVGPVLGVLYDLGVSSMQLDRGERGFSFRADAPLDMRMDPSTGVTAADLVNDLDQLALVDLIRRYGEERMAGRIAAAIVAARPLRTTTELAAVVERSVPAAVRRQPTHPATRTFQALRIAVNGELDRFRASLPQALELAAPAPDAPDTSGAVGRRGGRVAVLSYHSLEDRICKELLVEAARGCICPPDLPVCGCGRAPLVTVLTRGAERATAAEIELNPRARSARLRAAERTAATPHEGGR
jgi:16S rRNA (cytosine1402-N4)-methyltransferase